MVIWERDLVSRISAIHVFQEELGIAYEIQVSLTMDPSQNGMKRVLEQMKSPAPKHIVDGLCHRLKQIEMAEGKDGEAMANECRSFLDSKKVEGKHVRWMDVMMAAYHINGGIILREVTENTNTSPTMTNASAASTPSTSKIIAKSPKTNQQVTEVDIDEIENMVKSLGVNLDL